MGKQAPRSQRVAVVLFAALLVSGPAARGDDSEAGKAAAPAADAQADAEKKAGLARAEAANAFEEFRPKLENLGLWCAGFELSLEKSRIADALLAFDPDNAKGREWLGYKRIKNGGWKSGPWHTYSNDRPDALAEFTKRRSEIADPLRARVVPVLTACPGWRDAGLRDRVVRALIDLYPDEAQLRTYHGEVEVKGRWLLRESAETPANRERLGEASVAAKAAAAKINRRIAAGPPRGWATTVTAPGFGVWSELPAEETSVVAEAVSAGQIFFGKALGVDARLPANARLYLFPDAVSNNAFLQRTTGIDPEQRRRFANLGSYWLRPTECVVAREAPDARVDSATRQMMSVLRGSFTPLYDAPPWLGEGVGMYLTYRLLGTRKTVFVETGSYSDESISRDVSAVDADWVAVAKKLVDKGVALDIPILTGLPLNSMSKDDGLVAYALSTYFVEGRPKDLVALLTALGRKDVHMPQALAEVCNMDAEGLQARFIRWLHEVPAK